MSFSFLWPELEATNTLLIFALVVTLTLAFASAWRNQVVKSLGWLGMFFVIAHAALAFYIYSVYADSSTARVNDLIWDLHAVTMWAAVLFFFSVAIIMVVRYFRARKERLADKIRLESVPMESAVIRAMHAEPAGPTPRM